MKPTISVIHPSRSRPAQAAATAKAWLSSAKDLSRIEYIISIDKSDDKAIEYMRINPQAGINFSILPAGNKNAIEAINTAAADCKGDIILVISDDFSTPPFHWDEYLIQALSGKSDYVAKTQDGIQKTLVTLPIVDRIYYERYGYVYNPAYSHMFCDQELTAVAIMTGKLITLPIKISHNHYSTGKTAKDAVNVKNDATWDQGQAVFNQNLSNNFGIPASDIVLPYNQIKWH